MHIFLQISFTVITVAAQMCCSPSLFSPNLIQTVIIIYRSTGGLFHHSDLCTFSSALSFLLSEACSLMDKRVDVHSSDGLLCLSERVNPCESGPFID